jgi:hypothetical protein
MFKTTLNESKWASGPMYNRYPQKMSTHINNYPQKWTGMGTLVPASPQIRILYIFTFFVYIII